MSFIFGGDTGLTYDQIQSRRKIAEQMMGRGGTPRNVGEGITSFAGSISGALMQKRLDKKDAENQAKSDELWGGIFGGMGGGGGYSAPTMSSSGAPSQFDAMAANGGPTNAAASAMNGGLPGSIVQSESGGNWRALNSEGYGGRGQFGEARLADAARAGVIPAGMTGADYSRAPEQVQLAVENWHKKDILGDLGGYVGMDVDGAGPIPPLTEDSILAVAHLGGTGGARKFVESGGRYNPSDSNGTSLADYATRHAGGQTTMSARGGPSQGGGGMGGANIQQIAQALSDPYIRRDPGKVAILNSLMQQQMQASQPMSELDQINLERQRFELDRLQNPQADPRATELTDEEEAALGLPTDGVYQRLPDGQIKPVFEGAAGADPTAAMQNYDFMVSQGIPQDVAAQRAFGSGGTTINNNMPGQDKFADEFGKLDAASMGTVAEAGLAATRNLGRIDQLEGLLAASPSGAGASLKSLAGNFGINTEGLDDIQAAKALINSLVPEQRQPGSGPMSDADLALFKESLPRLINQPGGNQKIIETMRAIAEYDAAGAQVVQRLRAGEIDRGQAFDLLYNRASPVAGFGEAPPPSDPIPVTGEGSSGEMPVGINPAIWESSSPAARAQLTASWPRMTAEEKAMFQ